MKLKWTHELLKIEALKYIVRTDFQKYSPGAYQAAVKRGVLDEICSHMPKRILRPYKWTLKKLIEEVKKSSTRAQFKKQSSGAWDAAYKMGVLEQLYAFLEPVKNEPFTYEEVKEKADLCVYRVEFQRKYGAEYHWAHRNNLLDEICALMKPSRGSSSQETKLRSALREVYSDLRMIRRKASISGKEFITRMEVDIHSPSLKIGIEFDGTYWHSMEGLRRSHPTWPNEDLLNYHHIKDTFFFETYGIRILHIKEEEWDIDPQACIQRCLDFLSGKISV